MLLLASTVLQLSFYCCQPIHINAGYSVRLTLMLLIYLYYIKGFVLVYRVQRCQITEVVLYTKVLVDNIARGDFGLFRCWIRKHQLYQLLD